MMTHVACKTKISQNTNSLQTICNSLCFETTYHAEYYPYTEHKIKCLCFGYVREMCNDSVYPNDIGALLSRFLMRLVATIEVKPTLTSTSNRQQQRCCMSDSCKCILFTSPTFNYLINNHNYNSCNDTSIIQTDDINHDKSNLSSSSSMTADQVTLRLTVLENKCNRFKGYRFKFGLIGFDTIMNDWKQKLDQFEKFIRRYNHGCSNTNDETSNTNNTDSVHSSEVVNVKSAGATNFEELLKLSGCDKYIQTYLLDFGFDTVYSMYTEQEYWCNIRCNGNVINMKRQIFYSELDFTNQYCFKFGDSIDMVFDYNGYQLSFYKTKGKILIGNLVIGTKSFQSVFNKGMFYLDKRFVYLPILMTGSCNCHDKGSVMYQTSFV